MSLRAVILAMFGAVFIATVGYFNDQVPRLNHFVGNQFPIAVFFPLLAIAWWINPLLGRWRLKAGEQAVIVALLLVACNVPGSGLMRWWSRLAATPLQYNRGNVAWNKVDALSYAPPGMLANSGQYNQQFVQGVYLGGKSNSEWVRFDQIPWEAWRGPIVTWMPLAVAFAVASICLALIVHRTWSTRERLPYPIAQLAVSLIETPQSGRSIFRDRKFITGFLIVLGIHLANGAFAWSPGVWIRDPLYMDFGSNFDRFLRDAWSVPWGGNSVAYFTLYPALAAFACFVARDVSFSVGISVFVWTVIGTALYLAGVKFDWVMLEGGVMPWQSAGSTIAIGAALIYFGRNYYRALLRRVIGLAAPGETVEPREVWAGRIFVVSGMALVWLLTLLGVAWPLAILAIVLFLLAYVVIARITVESGLMLVQMQWQPLAVLAGLFGVESLGLRAMTVLALMGFVFSHERRECLMPLMLNGLKICDARKGVTAGRIGAMSVLVFVIAVLAAVPFGLWVDHNYGLQGGEGFSTAAGWYTFNMVARQAGELADAGRLDASNAYTTFERLVHASPDTLCLIALAAGAAVVAVLMALRLRFTWWPIHPILFVIWGTWAARETAFSFLLGWLIKTVTTRMGVRHESLKTFMIGVIAGDLIGGVFWMIVGGVYFYVTGSTPMRYFTFPGG